MAIIEASKATDLTAKIAFIKANTRVVSLDGLRGLSLYCCDQLTPLWLLTEQDLDDERIAPPYWAFAWAGGQAVARYIFDHPKIVAGKRVLDLACGSGLVGIAAKLSGAKVVFGNDIDPFCRAALVANAALNNVDIGFIAGDILGMEIDDIGQFDVILAGDIAYEKTMSQSMFSFLHRAHSRGVEVYIGDPHRSYFAHENMVKCADYVIETSLEIEDNTQKQARVWKMERRYETP